MIAQILCALLITVGLFYLFKVRPSDMAGKLAKPFKRWYDKMKRIRRITGKPKGKLAATADNAKEMLSAAGMGGQIASYRWAAVILALLGLLMGLALNNILAALVLAAGLGCSPLIVIRIRTGDYVRSLNEKLESAMGTVTNSYVASGDLIGAVQSSLHLLPAPLDGVFRQFYAETQLIDSDVVKAIHRLRERIDNRYWYDWCDCAGAVPTRQAITVCTFWHCGTAWRDAARADGDGHHDPQTARRLHRHGYDRAGSHPADGYDDA